MVDQEEDFSSLPLPDRFQHKIWKVRKAGYEDAAKQFEVTTDEYDPAFKPFLQDPGLWKGAVADSNVAAQQEGIAALCAFLKFGGREHCTRTRGHTVTSLVEKGLSSTRAATKASSLEALLLYIELDIAAPLIDDLIPSLSNKQPKIVAVTLSALTAIYHNYGCKIVDPKPALKALPKAFSHADKNVRAEATKLAVEFYRWLREAMKPMFWADLKSTQQTEIESLFEKIKSEPVPKQERLLRSQQAEIASAPSGDSGNIESEHEAEEEAEIDVFAMLEPQDVLSKVPPNFSEQMASKKWKDRKEALEELFKILDVPKIKEGDFGDIIRELAKCMKDANIAVVTQAAQCIEVLAKGLRKPFGKYRSIVADPIMERMKEKKVSVSDALSAAMDQVFLASSLSENLEEILAKLQHKNPQVREGTVKFLIRCLKTTKEAPSKQEVASISEVSKKLLAEPTEVLRLGGAEALGTVMKIMGERAMGPYMEGLDEIKKAKIKEYFATAEVKAKDKPKPPPAAVTRPAPVAAPRKVVAKKPATKKSAPPPSIYAQEALPATQAAARSATSSKTGSSKASGLVTPGLKAPTKRIPASSGAASSPRRATTQPPSIQEDVIPTPRIGLGRGLAGRSLTAKPPAAITIPSNPISPPLDSGWSTAEKTELEELRRDKNRLLRQNDELRQEKSRLNSEIQELKNETAQLIENRARDSLTIMSKETQLVRTRSECEAAEAMCGQLRREMERLKRALTSAERVNSPTALSPTRESASDDVPVYRESGIFGNVSDNRQAYNRSRLSYTSTLSEEKENGDLLSPPHYNQLPTDLNRNSRPNAVARGRSSPASHLSHQTSRLIRDTSLDGARVQSQQGVESWKRAAEVTNALRAKIEHMKARQGISRS